MTVVKAERQEEVEAGPGAGWWYSWLVKGAPQYQPGAWQSSSLSWDSSVR